MSTRFALAFCLFIALTTTPCHARELGVMVSVTPLKFFTERIGGDRVDVSVMVPPGASPATYEPRPRQMVALSKAELYVAVGVPFEKAWLPRMRDANPSLTVIRSTAGIDLLKMPSHHHGHDDDGHEEEHDGIPDPHVWTSPTESKKVADAILTALIAADPEGSGDYQRNHETLVRDIDVLDGELRQVLAGKEGTQFLVYHPSWGYFARDYGLRQVPVELEGKEPGPRELAAVIKLAKRNGITVVFAQPQFSEKSARIVADALDGQVVPADPLAEDWDTNLRRVARAIRDALR